ncbi:MAG: phosphonate metabolism protein/1,5-bisphosphokinase (PRPP-forming) PhnN [Pseudomonadota bacterium]
MNQGRLIAVVGPSGVGKDSLMLGIHAAVPETRLVRRTITRAPGMESEQYDSVSKPTFDEMVESGAFLLYWDAHGLSYGIPKAVATHVTHGTDCLVNLSRNVLPQAAEIFPSLVVLNITASPEILAARLTARGRETEGEIVARLAQANKTLPEGLVVVEISNDGPLRDTVAEAVALLQPARA